MKVSVTLPSKSQRQKNRQALYASIALAVVPLVLLAIPHVRAISRKAKTSSDRIEHLTQVAQYYKARACYGVRSNTGLKIGDIIPDPQETACYEVWVGNTPAQWVYVIRNPDTGLIQVASVFTRQELNAKLSEIQS